MAPEPASTERQFEQVLAGNAPLLDALSEVHASSWETVDAELLDLCRLRVATLLGHEPSLEPESAEPELLSDLARWPTSSRFSATQRACLAFTEQFVIDVASMDDDLVAAVRAALGADGLLDFTNALLVVEQRQRLSIMWHRLFPEEAA